ncbi:unnamed protein product, partial [marine sediment metagenome]
MQDMIVEHLKEELTAEETKGQSGWKICYVDNRAPEVKYFDKFGRL